jgi:hypothetical protein
MLDIWLEENSCGQITGSSDHIKIIDSPYLIKEFSGKKSMEFPLIKHYHQREW